MKRIELNKREKIQLLDIKHQFDKKIQLFSSTTSIIFISSTYIYALINDIFNYFKIYDEKVRVKRGYRRGRILSRTNYSFGIDNKRKKRKRYQKKAILKKKTLNLVKTTEI